MVIESRHPVEGGDFHRFHRFPRGTAVNQFGFVKAINSFRQFVVVAVTTASYRRFYARLAEALDGVAGDFNRWCQTLSVP